MEGFLGNYRKDDYAMVVTNLIESYEKLGCRTSLKLHFLHCHLDFFRDNLRNVSEEHGERFHQDIQEMEKRYQGRWNETMMGDYVWNLMRKCNTTYKRKIIQRPFFIKMFYGLFAMSLTVIFFYFARNISNPLCVIHKLEIMIS